MFQQGVGPTLSYTQRCVCFLVIGGGPFISQLLGVWVRKGPLDFRMKLVFHRPLISAGKVHPRPQAGREKASGQVERLV